MIGSRATEHREPCQVLTEAALSGTFGVKRVCLKGAACRYTSRERFCRRVGARLLFSKMKLRCFCRSFFFVLFHFGTSFFAPPERPAPRNFRSIF